MPQQPKITGDNQVDSWALQVTQELNDILPLEVVANFDGVIDETLRVLRVDGINYSNEVTAISFRNVTTTTGATPSVALTPVVGVAGQFDIEFTLSDVYTFADGTDGTFTVTPAGGPAQTVNVGDTDTTYAFVNGTDGTFTVTPEGGATQTVNVGVTDEDTTYTFADGTDGTFTVTPEGGDAQTVDVGSATNLPDHPDQADDTSTDYSLRVTDVGGTDTATWVEAASGGAGGTHAVKTIEFSNVPSAEPAVDDLVFAGGPTTTVVASVTGVDEGFRFTSTGVFDRGIIETEYGILNEGLFNEQVFVPYVPTFGGPALGSIGDVGNTSATPTNHEIYVRGQGIEWIIYNDSTDTWSQYQFRDDFGAFVFGLEITGPLASSPGRTVSRREIGTGAVAQPGRTALGVQTFTVPRTEAFPGIFTGYSYQAAAETDGTPPTLQADLILEADVSTASAIPINLITLSNGSVVVGDILSFTYTLGTVSENISVTLPRSIPEIFAILDIRDALNANADFAALATAAESTTSNFDLIITGTSSAPASITNLQYVGTGNIVPTTTETTAGIAPNDGIVATSTYAGDLTHTTFNEYIDAAGTQFATDFTADPDVPETFTWIADTNTLDTGQTDLAKYELAITETDNDGNVGAVVTEVAGVTAVAGVAADTLSFTYTLNGADTRISRTLPSNTPISSSLLYLTNQTPFRVTQSPTGNNVLRLTSTATGRAEVTNLSITSAASNATPVTVTTTEIETGFPPGAQTFTVDGVAIPNITAGLAGTAVADLVAKYHNSTGFTSSVRNGSTTELIGINPGPLTEPVVVSFSGYDVEEEYTQGT